MIQYVLVPALKKEAVQYNGITEILLEAFGSDGPFLRRGGGTVRVLSATDHLLAFSITGSRRNLRSNNSPIVFESRNSAPVWVAIDKLCYSIPYPEYRFQTSPQSTEHSATMVFGN